MAKNQLSVNVDLVKRCVLTEWQLGVLNENKTALTDKTGWTFPDNIE